MLIAVLQRSALLVVAALPVASSHRRDAQPVVVRIQFADIRVVQSAEAVCQHNRSVASPLLAVSSNCSTT